MAGNFHLGITCWSEELWDEQKDNEILKPWVQGRMMSDKIMGYCNMVGYLEARDSGRRILRFDLTDTYYGKDQFNAFKNHRLVDPTMPKIMDALKAARVAAVSNSTQRRRRSASKKRRRATSS
jgi:hypothetical protein